MVPLIALRDLPYFSGRRVAKGDTFTASSDDAKILKLGKLAKDAPQPRVWAEPDATEEKPKRTYRRRDQTAEPE